RADRAGDRGYLPPRRLHPGRHDARHGRLHPAQQAPRGRPRCPGPVPHRQGRRGGPYPRPTIGADDYVTKPFSLEEVITRLRVILRRVAKDDSEESSLITYEDITLDDDMHEVTKAGEVVD